MPGKVGDSMLIDLIPDCKEKLKTHIPYIGRARVPWYCFGDYERWKTKMFRCNGSCRVQRYCRDRDISRITWSPIVARASRNLGKQEQWTNHGCDRGFLVQPLRKDGSPDSVIT